MKRLLTLGATALVLHGCVFGTGRSPKNEDVGQPDLPVDMGTRDIGSETGVVNDMPPDTRVDTCGDGALQADEACDPGLPDQSAGSCPTSCDDGVACTLDRIAGAPETCDAACVSEPIVDCVSDDGCCPGGCGIADDNDCTGGDICGDGQVTGSEACDPAIPLPAPGSCPATRADCAPMTCSSSVIAGSASSCSAVCEYNAITTCTDDDGCCPTGCDDATDSDCTANCGDGVIQPGESCDGNCPAACDDMDACTTDTVVGSATTCDAVCSFSDPNTTCIDNDGCCPTTCSNANDNDCSATCSNGSLEVGETCDEPNFACETDADCDDGDVCTSDRLSGSAANCNAACTQVEISACSDTPDGCCPTACNANNDADCVGICPNGAVEPPELCDGNCPTDCDDNDACTADSRTGDASTCDVECMNRTITMCADGDGCCPIGCNALNDDDCGPVCPNQIVEAPETCDGNCPAGCNDNDACTVDSMTGAASTCDVVCTYSMVSSCIDGDGCCAAGCTASNDDDCSVDCGDGMTEGDETCDGADCPTDADCAAMGACFILTGNAATCTAQCTPDPECVACDLNDVCACSSGEECIGGRCTTGTGGQCLLACNQDAYCGIWGGSGWVCNPSNSKCESCLAIVTTETSCNDGRDDDCDGFVDCDDADCPASVCGHVLAATVQAHVGNLGGRAGADAKCAAQALNYGFDPAHNWKAVISTAGQSATQAISILGTVYRVDGLVLTASANLFASLDRRVQRFNGLEFTTHTPIWTGTTSSGTTTPFHCSSWTAGGVLQFGGIGNANATGSGWIDANCVNNPSATCNRCDKSNQLYCINRQ